MDNNTKYNREVRPGVFIDVYDVLWAFGVDNPGIQHAIKKLLAAGSRGQKTKGEDLLESIIAIEKAIGIEKLKTEIEEYNTQIEWEGL